MAFFDKKEDVLGISLTPHGRHLLSKGELMPVYYSFLDDDILYDITAANGTESNYQVKNRILVETPSLRPQTNFSDLDVKFRSTDRDIYKDVLDLNIYTIGSSNKLENFAPSWEIDLIQNQISSSSPYLSSSKGEQNIPQIDMTIDYTMSVGDINSDATPRGLAPSPELQVGTLFDDGTYLKLEPDQILARVLEKNGFSHMDAIEIEAYKYDDSDQQKLIPLSFLKNKEHIVDDILLDDVDPTDYVNEQDVTPDYVEYFFEVRVDKEIPLSDICSGIKELRSKGIFGDFEIECPDVGQNLQTDIYSSPVTPEDIERCDT